MCKLVREFLLNIEKELIEGKSYSFRIDVNDGGINSYIGFNVDVDDYRNRNNTYAIRLYRHTNSLNKMIEMWGFELGNIAVPYNKNKDIPIGFFTYGKSADEAEAEAKTYFKEILKIVKKKTNIYRQELAKYNEAEKEQLLKRLSELDNIN